ncbi:hypothetical protein SteCoe_20542 [Stentor coeruleus]|uniref:Uncharacterized protein n=1 Tax=Stentor coeruleus TaxID=5963 RepID=A0A1R2BRQ8_9CILI|nr:hypothetical protein SteCoe_20542 [Stentor coeruleus]
MKNLSATIVPTVQSIFDIPSIKKIHEAKTQDLLNDSGFGDFNDVFPISPSKLPSPSALPISINQPVTNSGLKVNFNFSNDSGATIEQIKLYGRTDFSDFKAAPETVNKHKDLESKLFNLDDLQAVQPKPEEVVKSRW